METAELERRVKLQWDANGQFVCIPPEFKPPSDDVIIRKVGNRLILESAQQENSRLEHIDEDFPEIEELPSMSEASKTG
jgi:virulence-associated protein VagC